MEAYRTYMDRLRLTGDGPKALPAALEAPVPAPPHSKGRHLRAAACACFAVVLLLFFRFQPPVPAYANYPASGAPPLTAYPVLTAAPHTPPEGRIYSEPAPCETTPAAVNLPWSAPTA